IVTQPTNVTVIVGQSAAFAVVATNALPLSYQWMFNGTNISGATNASYAIASAQFTNAGNYSVQVANVAGALRRLKDVLAVNHPPAVVSVVNAGALDGASVNVPITLVANGNENGVNFSLTFDTNRLVYSDATTGSGASDATILPNVGNVGSGVLGIQL